MAKKSTGKDRKPPGASPPKQQQAGIETKSAEQMGGAEELGHQDAQVNNQTSN